MEGSRFAIGIRADCKSGEGGQDGREGFLDLLRGVLEIGKKLKLDGEISLRRQG